MSALIRITNLTEDSREVMVFMSETMLAFKSFIIFVNSAFCLANIHR